MSRHSSQHRRFFFPMLIVTIIWTGCNPAPPPFDCHDPIGCLALTAGQPLKIGVLQALSGKVAPLGRDQLRGIELALEGQAWRFLGHPIELQIEDTGCSPEGGANAALKIIADPQTAAILGTTCSAAAATASQAISDAGLTMVSGNNSAPFLTAMAGQRARDWQPGFFRTASNEEMAGKAAAIYTFAGLGIRRAATINDGDIYTKGLTGGFESAFTRLGGEITLSATIDKGDRQMQPVLTAVLNANAQLLFFPLFQPEGNHILLQAKKTEGFEKIVLMSDGALIENSFIQAVGEKAIGMLFVGPARPKGPLVDDLTRAYTVQYGAAPSTSYYLNAFDATRLLLDAMARVAVRHADGTLYLGRQQLRDALLATAALDGVTGRLACDEFGDCARPVFNVLRLDDPKAGVEGLQANVMYTHTLTPKDRNDPP